ncbi:unnamed protein product [Closterium sp. Naga37s-1]|nr:unnamed protein product [Closterium sp. Naga37s-1]
MAATSRAASLLLPLLLLLLAASASAAARRPPPTKAQIKAEVSRMAKRLLQRYPQYSKFSKDFNKYVNLAILLPASSSLLPPPCLLLPASSSLAHPPCIILPVSFSLYHCFLSFQCFHPALVPMVCLPAFPPFLPLSSALQSLKPTPSFLSVQSHFLSQPLPFPLSFPVNSKYNFSALADATLLIPSNTAAEALSKRLPLTTKNIPRAYNVTAYHIVAKRFILPKIKAMRAGQALPTQLRQALYKLTGRNGNVPRDVPFLMRLLVAWVTFYYSIFMDAVSRSVGGLLEANVFTEEVSSASSSRGSNLTAERKRRSGLRRRRYQLLLEDLEGMGEEEFRDLFRINRAILDYIVNGMAHYMQPYVDRYLITHEVACLVAIKYLASGMSFRDLSAVFGLSKTLCHTLVDALLMHFPTAFKQQWVHFPSRDDLDEMAEEFRAIKGVPAVVGAIDGTHIPMKGMEGHRQEYYTRKSCYAVQLQITCDAVIQGFVSHQPVGAST